MLGVSQSFEYRERLDQWSELCVQRATGRVIGASHPCTLVLGASERFVYRELSGRVTIVQSSAGRKCRLFGASHVLRLKAFGSRDQGGRGRAALSLMEEKGFPL